MNFLLIVTVLLATCFYFMFAEYKGENPEPNDSLILQLTVLTLIIVTGGLLLSNILAKKDKESWGAMQYPQLVLGMIAIFVYVGVEVTIQSNLGELLVGFIKVLIPELNLGQLDILIRSQFLIDTKGYNVVAGKPFKSNEILTEIEKII